MSVIPASQIRNGMVIIYENEPYKVVNFRFTMQGRGSNTIPCKLKSLISGASAEPRFRSDDKIERAFIEEKEMEYLYEDGEDVWFMNPEDFDQFSLKKDELEDVMGYLLPNMRVQIQFYEGKAIGVTPPNTVQLKVVETEPSIKGATASGNVTTPAKLETGITVQVPL
ncbi:MAG: elongation factor P, partial [Chitinispirillaceae bacterium]